MKGWHRSDQYVCLMKMGRRSPTEPACVQAVADAKIVWQRRLLDEGDDRSVGANPCRVVGEDVVAIHAVSGDRDAAHRDPGEQVATGVDETGRVAGKVDAICCHSPSHEAAYA